MVAVLAAWSGFTFVQVEHRVVAHPRPGPRRRASRASRYDLEASNLKNSTPATFNTWFTAYIGGDPAAEQVAIRRFRPAFKVAFDAWMTTDPLTNPRRPPGPTYMKEYKQPEQDLANAMDAEATSSTPKGPRTAPRPTTTCARPCSWPPSCSWSAYFGHFRVRVARYGLVGVGAVILVVAVAILASAPEPPA